MDYWTSTFNGLCWLAFLGGFFFFVVGLCVWGVGTYTRSHPDTSVRSEEWISGCLRQQDGVRCGIVSLLLFLGVIFIPCNHHPSGVCHDHYDGTEICHK